ncbi:MAG: branched-chain amino acid ABC transporter permease [Actinomycetota bacterium]|nr:branched-chain amino acid ABC transporter permease [Actinomycetota bacterium]
MAEKSKAETRKEEGLGSRFLALVVRNKILLILAFFIAIMPVWADPISKPLGIDLVYVMRLVGVFTIVAVGLNLLMGYAGQISLGHGAFFGVGAYTSALLTVKAGFPVWFALILSIVVAAIVGLLVAPILRLKGHYLAMATLGLGIIAFVFFRELVWLTNGNDGVRGIPELALPGLNITTRKGEYFFVWILALLVLILCGNIVRSRQGRAIKALHHSEVAAEAMGINVSWHKIKIFMFSAALGGLAGGVFAHLQGYIDPGSFSIMLSIELVTMVVVGGMESIWGAVAGAGVILFIPEIIEALPKWLGDVPRWVERYSLYEGILFGLILILTMIFMPSGITKGLSDMTRFRRSPFVNPFRKKGVE